MKIASHVNSIDCIVLYLNDINLPILNTLMFIRLGENHINITRWNASLHCVLSCKLVIYGAQYFHSNPQNRVISELLLPF